MPSAKLAALQALQLMDLTSLNENDTPDVIINLCKNAQTEFAKVAAVCVYSQFIQTAKAQLAEQNCSDVKVATVTNFPHGGSDIELAVNETRAAIELGADEVDVVFPYQALMAGDKALGFELVKQCKAVCSDRTLKVIIETGELKTPELIKLASEISINAGADFIKTSTGKVPVNATLESAAIMLNVIKEMSVADRVGFKAAGGVRTAKEAKEYLALTASIFDQDWINPKHFRFGASSLLSDLLVTLGDTTAAQNSAPSQY